MKGARNQVAADADSGVAWLQTDGQGGYGLLIRRVLPFLVVTLASLGVAVAASANGFKYGVNAGEVSSSSAVLWTRSDRAGRLTLQVSRDSASAGE